MTKFETTQKYIKALYNNNYIIRIGYCDAQALLHFQEPMGYTAGVYGWNADIYDFSGFAIVTGYRPFGGVQIDFDLLRKYELKARKWVEDYNTPYETRKKRVNTLLKNLIKKVYAKEA